jgi:hypothetical protein
MKALNAYISQQNSWNSLFSGNKVVYEVNTPEGRKFVAQSIDAALSPENLSCDGELPRSQVQARYRALTGAAKDLIKLDPSVAQYMYEFSEA